MEEFESYSADSTPLNCSSDTRCRVCNKLTNSNEDSLCSTCTIESSLSSPVHESSAGNFVSSFSKLIRGVKRKERKKEESEEEEEYLWKSSEEEDDDDDDFPKIEIITKEKKEKKGRKGKKEEKEEKEEELRDNCSICFGQFIQGIVLRCANCGEHVCLSCKDNSSRKIDVFCSQDNSKKLSKYDFDFDETLQQRYNEKIKCVSCVGCRLEFTRNNITEHQERCSLFGEDNNFHRIVIGRDTQYKKMIDELRVISNGNREYRRKLEYISRAKKQSPSKVPSTCFKCSKPFRNHITLSCSKCQESHYCSSCYQKLANAKVMNEYKIQCFNPICGGENKTQQSISWFPHVQTAYMQSSFAVSTCPLCKKEVQFDSLATHNFENAPSAVCPRKKAMKDNPQKGLEKLQRMIGSHKKEIRTCENRNDLARRAMERISGDKTGIYNSSRAASFSNRIGTLESSNESISSLFSPDTTPKRQKRTHSFEIKPVYNPNTPRKEGKSFFSELLNFGNL